MILIVHETDYVGLIFCLSGSGIFAFWYLGAFLTSWKRIIGWMWVLGCSPIPIDLLMALAIFLWLTGRSPVSLECLMRPIDVMNSAMIEKFCKVGQRSSDRVRHGAMIQGWSLLARSHPPLDAVQP